MANRPKLSRPLERAVKVEAGDRCAIPTCHQYPVEIAHIEPRKADGSNDTFENLIALCPTCHARYDKGEIDRLAMRQYKATLSILNVRYGDFERRVLEEFADHPAYRVIRIPGGLDIMFKYLVQDGLVRKADPSEVTNAPKAMVVIAGVPSHEFLAITKKGIEFIRAWLVGSDIDNPMRFRRVGDSVEIEGSIVMHRPGEEPAQPGEDGRVTVVTLPEEFRPSETYEFVAATATGTTVVTIGPDGNFRADPAAGQMTLLEVRFPLAAPDNPGGAIGGEAPGG